MAESSGSAGKALGCLGCGSLATLPLVFIAVAARSSFWNAGAAASALLLLWLAVVGIVSSKRAAAHQAARDAQRATEVVEHAAYMAAKEAHDAAQRQAYMAAKEAEKAARYATLCGRFGERSADAIMAGRYWQGATVEMIEESLGLPDDVKEKVYKTKTKATYYYRPISAQRYELKIHFEDGVVVGWDE